MLIDRILTNSPGVELFVAQITPETNATLEARVQAYNAALPISWRARAHVCIWSTCTAR